MSPSRHHRFDRDRSARRARARAHLERVRRRGDAGGGPPAALPRGPRWSRAGAGVALVAAVLGLWFGDALLLAWLDDALPLDVIAVRGAAQLPADEVARSAGVPVGAPARDVDEGAVVRSLEGHAWIAAARALRVPGGALLVEVREREPVATVSLDEQLYAVDAAGEPFAPVAADALPALVRIVTLQGEARPGEPNPHLATAARLARRLPELGLSAPREVSVASEDDPRGYALRLAALDAQVVLGRSDLDARLDALARLLSERPDVAADAESIDLRFADQVVLRSAPARDGSASQADGRGDARPRNQRPTG